MFGATYYSVRPPRTTDCSRCHCEATQRTRRRHKNGDELRICVDRMLPPERSEEGLKAAAKEDPKNDFLGELKKLKKGDAPPIIGTPQGVFIYGKKWEQKRELRISFLEGDPAIQKKVQEHAEKWMEYVNLRFKFVNSGKTDVRIAFNSNDGSWSYIGTDNLTIPQIRPTMNFGWLKSDSKEDVYSSVVLHKFGHMLGMGHERQSPVIGEVIEWDRAQVIKDCWEKMGWSAQMVEQQVFLATQRTRRTTPNLTRIR